MDKNSRILVLGASGMVGSAVESELMENGYTNIFTPINKAGRYMTLNYGLGLGCDLTMESHVCTVFEKKQPEYVFLCAARAGGIKANSENGVDFLSTNLKIQQNVIEACHEFKVKRLIFLGSSCIYPRNAPQPLKEEYLLTGELEPTNKPYAIAKIAGIELCQAYNREYKTDFISVMPCNLYGTNDRYGSNGHVIPMLLEKFHQAKVDNAPSVEVWGSGTPYREFLNSQDLARALIMIMSDPRKLPDLINVGSGQEVTIKQLAEIIQQVTEYKGWIEWNTSMPDGTPRKILDCTLLKSLYEWEPLLGLKKGIQHMYEDFKRKQQNGV